MDTVPQLSLSDILRSAEGCSFPWEGDGLARGRSRSLAAEVEWRAAIAALGHVLKALPWRTASGDGGGLQGIVLSGPLPVLNEADLGQRLETWVITPQPLAEALNGRRSLLPSSHVGQTLPSQPFQALPCTLHAPLLKERFCLVVTPTFSLGLVLGEPLGDGVCLQYSFDPQVLLALWQTIRAHVAETVADSLDQLDKQLSHLLGAPDYRIITRFTQAMVASLPHRFADSALTYEDRGTVRFAQWSEEARRTEGNGTRSRREARDLGQSEGTGVHPRHDTELLQAMAHEIRTPLTTIRTLTRSLMRRKDLSAEIQRRLARIDQECTQQIDRFNLIFRAVELETTQSDRPRSALTPIALSQVFQDAIPRWQQQAHRRNLSLDVTLPPDLPRVTSDPTLLNQVLTGVVEWFTQCLPAQSHIQMRVMLAGHQLKLQFEAEGQPLACPLNGSVKNGRQPLKSLGQLLMVAPDTGGLSLNLDVTKNLFQFLGGKLIVRQRPTQGDVLTVFLPLDTREV